MEPEEIAGYRVVRRLGAGGMGEVYLVEHPRLPRRDALKLLAPELSRSDDFAERFRREADVLATISHPNVVTLHDRGEWDGRLWLTMQYVDGPDAGALMRERGKLPPPLVAQIVDGAASALDYMYRRHGVTHRDVKPANLLLSFEGGERLDEVKLADFGIAKAVGDAAGMTATGTAVGTVSYLSPEAIDGRPVDSRSDQYALACTAYELFCGRPPFTGASPSEVLAAHLQRSVPALPGAGPAFDHVFARALAKNPDDRFPTCEEFAAAFTEALRRTAVEAPQAPPPRPGAMPPPGATPPPGAPPPPGMRPHPSDPAFAAATQAPRSSRSGRRLAVIAAVAVVVVAAIAVGLFFGLRGSSDDSSEGGSARASEVAGRYVKGIGNWSYQDYDGYLDALAWHTTSEFGAKMRESAEPLRQEIEVRQVSSTATIDDVSVDSTSPVDATVAVVRGTGQQFSGGRLVGNPFTTVRTVTMDCTRDCLVTKLMSEIPSSSTPPSH